MGIHTAMDLRIHNAVKSTETRNANGYPVTDSLEGSDRKKIGIGT